MAAKFTVEIRLGNAAMQTGGDIAEALRTAADQLEQTYEHDDIREWNGMSRGVFDTNGNSVGRWEVRS